MDSILYNMNIVCGMDLTRSDLLYTNNYLVGFLPPGIHANAHLGGIMLPADTVRSSRVGSPPNVFGVGEVEMYVCTSKYNYSMYFELPSTYSSMYMVKGGMTPPQSNAVVVL